MADFQSNTDLTSLGIKIVAASVDTDEQTTALASELGLDQIQMASGVNGPAVAEVYSAYLDVSNTPFLQPTAFILDPDGNVVQSLYSSSALSRLSAADVVQMVRMHSGQ